MNSEDRMRLSEAIREGCKYGPQSYSMLDFDGQYCVVGAAMKGVGGKYAQCENSLYDALREDYPVLAVAEQPTCGCPDVGGFGDGKNDLLCAMVHLNNLHRWSREAIAEWVEVVERKLGLLDEPKPEIEHEAELTAQVEAQYAADAIHGRPLEVD